jgi:hypothetical protein
MLPTLAAASKTMSKCMILTLLLSTLSFSLASDFEALSETDAQMSQGTLIYEALPETVKLNLFKSFQATYKRKVTAKSHLSTTIYAHLHHRRLTAIPSSKYPSIQKKRRKQDMHYSNNL